MATPPGESNPEQNAPKSPPPCDASNSGSADQRQQVTRIDVAAVSPQKDAEVAHEPDTLAAAPPHMDAEVAHEPDTVASACPQKDAEFTHEPSTEATSREKIEPSRSALKPLPEWLRLVEGGLLYGSVPFFALILFTAFWAGLQIQRSLARPATVISTQARAETISYVVDDESLANFVLPRALVFERGGYVCRDHISVLPKAGATVSYTMVEGSPLKIAIFKGENSKGFAATWTSRHASREAADLVYFVTPDRGQSCGAGTNLRLPIAGSMSIGTPKGGTDEALPILEGMVNVYGRAARLVIPFLGSDADKLYLADTVDLPVGSFLGSELPEDPHRAACPGTSGLQPAASWRGFVDAALGAGDRALAVSASTNAASVILNSPVTTQGRTECPDVISLTQSAHYKNDPTLHELLAIVSISIVIFALGLQFLSVAFTWCDKVRLYRG
jgi:hypothetical protein